MDIILQPTTDDLMRGYAAFSRIHTYEKYMKPYERFMPLLAGLGVLVFIGLIVIALSFGRSHAWRDFAPMIIVACSIVRVFHSQYQYQRDLSFLKELRGMYGESLPWLQEEQQLAAAREIDDAIAESQSRP